MKKSIFLFLSVFILSNVFSYDKLTLLNKASFEGRVVDLNSKQLKFNFQETIYEIPLTDIETLVFEDTLSSSYKKYLIEINSDNCSKGEMDAEMYHGKKGTHFALGVLFGPFAMIGTALSNPNPMNSKKTFSMSENKQLFNDPEYLICYKKTAKRKLIGMEALGWATWILIVLL